jgi:dihydroxy-acid dehydratase
MILGGSTNAVLHLIAIAHSVGINLTIDDFQSVSDRVPFIADLKPSGKYVMEDVHKIGGIPGSSSLLYPSDSLFGRSLVPSTGNYVPFSMFGSWTFPDLFPRQNRAI